MRPTDLRTAAARHFLGLTDTEYLLDVAHAALDSGIYAHGLVDMISREPMLADLGPLFDSAIKELGIKRPNWDEAINRVVEGYMVAIAEGADPLRVAARSAHDDYRRLRYENQRPMRDDRLFEPLIPLVKHHFQYDYYLDDDERTQAQLVQLDRDGMAIATNWCREHWLPIFDRSWLTTTVVALAQGIRIERAFDRLPILADALEDAGCDHADILDHCRGNGPHVRGCWVVDLVLGKE